MTVETYRFRKKPEQDIPICRHGYHTNPIPAHVYNLTLYFHGSILRLTNLLH